MATIAFTFSTNDFEYVVLTGTKANPILHSKGKILLPANYNIPQTVAWFEIELQLLLNNIALDMVCYRLTVMRVTNNYVSNVYYGQGILNLLCSKMNIKITYNSPSSITAKKLNQPKGSDLIAYVESLFGKQPSPWDKGIKETALIALINLQ